MATNDHIYLGKGSIYLDGRKIGNCSQLQLSHESEKKTLPDYESAGGGNAASLERISGVTAVITAHDLSPENVAVATRGAVTVYAGGAVTDEPHNDIEVGKLIVFDHIPNTGATITVKKGATTLTLDSDYELAGRSGIIPLAGGANTLANGDDLTVSYTGLADSVVEGIVNSGLEFELFFDGLNEAQSGRAVQVKAYKAKPSPGNLDFIGDDYAGLQLTFELIKDTTKNGTTASQYYTVKSASAA